MTGVSFIDSTIKDTLFSNCLCKYINFSGSNLSNLKIDSSNLEDSSFNECFVKNVLFCDSNFTSSRFSNCNLDGVDFRSNDISLIVMDRYSMKGIVLDSFQCRNIVGNLGVRVED